MRNIIEVRYALSMHYQLEMKAYERNQNFGLKGEAPMVKANMDERTFLTTTLKADIEVVLLHFADCNYVHYHELKEELRTRRLRLLDFHEHLAFIMKYPKEGAEFTIISFGTPLHLDSDRGNSSGSWKSGLTTGPRLGAYPNLRWDAHVPHKDDFFPTSGDPKLFFACTPR